MAPILIDHRGLVKLALAAVLLTAFSFAGGVLLGYLKAEVIYTAVSEGRLLPLPTVQDDSLSDLKQQMPATVEAGLDIDVDRPAVSPPEENQDIQISTEIPEQIPQVADQSAESSSQIAITVDSDHVSDTGLDDGDAIVMKPLAESHQPPVLTTRVTNDAFENVRYTIQVGVYGKLLNAQNMKEKLQHPEAYISEELSKRKVRRYNVRLGYFADKKSAIAALEDYRKNKKGDGYLVNFSSRNIMDFTGNNQAQLN